MIKIIKNGLTEEEIRKRTEQKEKQKYIKVKCNYCECEFITDGKNFEFTYVELYNPNGDNYVMPQSMYIVCPNCKRKIFGEIFEKDGARKFLNGKDE